MVLDKTALGPFFFIFIRFLVALVLSSALWRSTFYYLLLYDVDMNAFRRLDDDFYDVNGKFYFPATLRSILTKSMVFRRVAAA